MDEYIQCIHESRGYQWYNHYNHVCLSKEMSFCLFIEKSLFIMHNQHCILMQSQSSMPKKKFEIKNSIYGEFFIHFPSLQKKILENADKFICKHVGTSMLTSLFSEKSKKCKIMHFDIIDPIFLNGYLKIVVKF